MDGSYDVVNGRSSDVVNATQEDISSYRTILKTYIESQECFKRDVVDEAVMINESIEPLDPGKTQRSDCNFD